MGVCGHEWFVHPWELGPRKAKEFLFTADVWSAEEAHRLGMVNHVVPRGELSAFVIALAQKIAAKPSFALKMTKEAVNRSIDVMGQPAAMIRRSGCISYVTRIICRNSAWSSIPPAFILPSKKPP